MNEVTVGTIIWEVIALEWNTEEKKMQVYRLNNNWAEVYTPSKMNIKKQSFLANLFLVVYHIFRYLFMVLFALAIFSLFINCVFKWKDVLKFIRSILIKLRGRGDPINSNDDDESFSVDHQGRRSRNIRRLPDELEDEI